MRATINLFNSDCLPAMRKMVDNQYNLCICDPPYKKCIQKKNPYQLGHQAKIRQYPKSKYWDIPGQDYFNEIIRISENQIIWGINYYNIANPGHGRIIWNKNNSWKDMSDCEIAFQSFNELVVSFEYTWAGMLQGNMKNKEIKIHKNQKPVALYKWLLKNYAKPGDKILDTHFGSLSIGIACWDYGYDLDAFEIDRDYFEAGKKRLDVHRAQLQIY